MDGECFIVRSLRVPGTEGQVSYRSEVQRKSGADIGAHSSGVHSMPRAVHRADNSQSTVTEGNVQVGSSRSHVPAVVNVSTKIDGVLGDCIIAYNVT